MYEARMLERRRGQCERQHVSETYARASASDHVSIGSLCKSNHSHHQHVGSLSGPVESDKKVSNMRRVFSKQDLTHIALILRSDRK